jgi:aminocarboxymuconate-semialdehyde decarboxylase
MSTRRDFLKDSAGAALGAVCLVRGGRDVAAQSAAPRRQVTVGGRRIKTIDVHAHCVITEVADLAKGTNLERRIQDSLEIQRVDVGPQRLEIMDADGIDVQALSVNPYWYSLDRDLARRIIDLQNAKLRALCAGYPDRFVAYATVALQFPELAAEQLEHAVKNLGLCGASIGASLEGEDVAARRFDPFWAKAEELQALVFMHPNQSPVTTGARARLRGNGALGNVIGNPLDTSLALAHLIFEGTFDRFPNLKICAAHGGGYLASYAARMDHGCSVFPEQCKGPVLKKKPSEYLKQIYFDSIVFTPEALRHLVAEHGAGQIVIGTDSPIPWVKNPVDHVLETPDLTDDQRIAILGGTAAKLLKIPT